MTGRLIGPYRVVRLLGSGGMGADLRNPSQALRIARRAVEVTKNADASALDTLASVYSALGSRSQAIETAEKALTLLPAAKPGEPPGETRQAIEAHLARLRSPAR